MKIYGDYHTHTVYSHGKGSVRENVERAREIGLKEIAITDHGLNHVIFGLRWWKVEKIIEEVEALRKEYTDIRILVGIESNIIGGRGRVDLTSEQIPFFDIILCGFHLPAWPDRFRDHFGMYMRGHLPFIPQGKRAVRRNTAAYIKAVKNYPLDVITHINKGVKVDCGAIAKECAEYGTYIELGTRHDSLEDSDYLAMLATDVKFIINSDAHRISSIGATAGVEEVIKKYNIPEERIVNLDGKKPVFRSEKDRKNGIRR